MWTEDYKLFLDTLLMDRSKPSKKQVLISFDDNSTETDVNFLLRFKPITLMRIIKKGVDKRGIGELEKILKLTSTKYTNLSNTHLRIQQIMLFANTQFLKLLMNFTIYDWSFIQNVNSI